MTELRRGHATLEIKAVDDDERVIEGVASTPTPDRAGDIMEPKGADFALPLPLLWQHDQGQPVGHVTAAKVSAQGITITARFAKVDTPGALKDRLDEAWLSVKAGLVRGLSIGWKPIEAAFNEKTGGIHALKWLWAELSVVTIPQNVEASILRIKELDLAASGRHSPSVVGLPVVTAIKGAARMAPTTAEQITSFTNTRAVKSARMVELMSKAADAGSTLDQQQTEEYDGLALEVKAIDAHLTRLRDLERTIVASATPVASATTPTQASDLRGGTPVVQVKANVPPGTAFTRFVLAKINGKGSISDAIRYAESRKDWMDTTPEVVLALKAAVNPGTITDTAWAAPLAVTRPMENEFIELLRARTVLDRIPGIRRVPFNISIPIQTTGGTYRWVGEGAPKPVGNLGFSSTTLGITKAAGIIVISEELAKISSPSAEATVRNDMIAGMAAYLDQQFLDPTVAAVTNVSPASITNGAQGVGTAGTSADNARTDIKLLITTMTNNNLSVADAVFVMSEANAFALAGAVTTLGVRPFADISATGGSVLGVPVITSQAAGNRVILIHTPSIILADDGGVNIDVSREASVEMNDAPTSPVAAATVLISLWQQNLIGLRAERFINWKRTRTTAVVYTTATYV